MSTAIASWMDVFSRFLIKPVSEARKDFIRLDQLIFHGTFLQYFYHIIRK